MITLVATSVRYWSQGDETAFFTWLQSLPCVRKVEGSGVDLFIDLDPNSVTDDDLRELDALFSRYQVDRRQLAKLETSERPWFRATRRPLWLQRAFG